MTNQPWYAQFLTQDRPTAEHNWLHHEVSPYLKQHERNPVNWFPWSAEALQKAKKENKPVFLSVGYS